VLRPIHGIFTESDFPELLVGLGSPDDAAVWRLSEDRSLVVTTDFFTPVVDDPYDYGAIAAANALSDVYAMGGQPFLALNIAALPPDLPVDISSAILKGGAEKVRQSGAVLAGGHTIQDKEPKYGLVVLGFVNPSKMVTKAGAQVGDRLILSKPLGFGTLTTALKRGQAKEEDVAEAVGWMKRLNREASLLANEFDLCGGTDITGFSLLGHAHEIAEASGVRLRFNINRIPFLTHSRYYADEWIFPGGTSDNKLFFSPFVQFAAGIDDVSQMLLFDAQTSGGLLLCVPASRLDAFLKRARQLDQPVWEVGEVVDGQGIEVLAE
jgi:selenide, water dikinase